MSSKPTFFFEEDPEAQSMGLTPKEKSESFFDILVKNGHVKEHHKESEFTMDDTLTAQSEMTEHTMENTAIRLQYGTHKDDYFLHMIPTHPSRNLSTQSKYTAALKEIVVELNKVVPPSLQVDIYQPSAKWEIKATSFVIRGGANSWGLDKKVLEEVVLPRLLVSLTEICARAQ